MIQATWLAGATVVCLPLPMRLGSIEEFASQTRRRVLNANARLVVVDPELEPFLALEPGDPPVVRLDEVRARAGAWERPLDDPDALGILQFTSGSTDDPKGVMLPQRCLVANIDAILEGAGLGPDDVGVSWLPLYHDMGLIGLLTTPMVTGFDLGLAPPQDFLAGPADWMRWISQMRATAGVEGVRAGNVIAFGAEGRRGREGIVVVAETKGDDLSALRAEVVARVCDVVGIPPRDVVLVRPGSLPKTFVGQAPAFAVSHAVSRRHARTRLISLH
jgi:hypothetical protein